MVDESTTRDTVERLGITNDLRGRLEATIQMRVDRYIEVSPHTMVPNHHFAGASAECVSLYVDGYLLSAVMVTQAVVEGIRRFVIERNAIKVDEGVDGPEAIGLLVAKGIISEGCAGAFNRIYGSFRNDVHHMNPKVGTIDFRELAKRNILDLAAIEREVFAFKWSDKGAIIPTNPRYWDARADGKVGVFLRLGP